MNCDEMSLNDKYQDMTPFKMYCNKGSMGWFVYVGIVILEQNIGNICKIEEGILISLIFWTFTDLSVAVF